LLLVEGRKITKKNEEKKEKPQVVNKEDLGSNQNNEAIKYFKRMGTGVLIKILSNLSNHYDLFRLKKS
jgi:hypothetical protein